MFLLHNRTVNSTSLSFCIHNKIELASTAIHDLDSTLLPVASFNAFACRHTFCFGVRIECLTAKSNSLGRLPSSFFFLVLCTPYGTQFHRYDTHEGVSIFSLFNSNRWKLMLLLADVTPAFYSLSSNNNNHGIRNNSQISQVHSHNIRGLWKRRFPR